MTLFCNNFKLATSYQIGNLIEKWREERIFKTKFATHVCVTSSFFVVYFLILPNNSPFIMTTKTNCGILYDKPNNGQWAYEIREKNIYFSKIFYFKIKQIIRTFELLCIVSRFVITRREWDEILNFFRCDFFVKI